MATTHIIMACPYSRRGRRTASSGGRRVRPDVHCGAAYVFCPADMQGCITTAQYRLAAFGYTGWASGQLEGELAQCVLCFTTPADAKLIVCGRSGKRVGEHPDAPDADLEQRQVKLDHCRPTLASLAHIGGEAAEFQRDARTPRKLANLRSFLELNFLEEQIRSQAVAAVNFRAGARQLGRGEAPEHVGSVRSAPPRRHAGQAASCASDAGS